MEGTRLKSSPHEFHGQSSNIRTKVRKNLGCIMG
jgi:hypothetical protein